MRPALSAAVEPIILSALLLTITTIVAFAASPAEKLQGEGGERDNSVYCNNLEEQYVNGKWKVFDLVLGDCLVQRFVHKAGEGVEFAQHLSDLEELTERAIKQYETEIKQLQSSVRGDGEGNNKIKLEVRNKAAKRQVENKKQELKKMLAEAKLEASLIETGVRDFMYKCSKPDKQSNTNTILMNNECNEAAKDNLIRARDLHNRLEADKTLLLAETINSLIKKAQN